MTPRARAGSLLAVAAVLGGCTGGAGEPAARATSAIATPSTTTPTASATGMGTPTASTTPSHAASSGAAPTATTPIPQTPSGTRAGTTRAPGPAATGGHPAPPRRHPACTRPGAPLLRWFSASRGSHAPLLAAVTVPAGRIGPHPWIVLAVVERPVDNDGRAIGGPTRTVALVNSLDGRPGSRALPLGGTDPATDRTLMVWDNVPWTGAALAQGRRAAAQALGCLDHGAGVPVAR